MSEDIALKTIDKLADVLGSTTTEVVSHYADWYLYSSIGWIVAGIALLISGIKWSFEYDDMPEIVYIIKGVMIVVGSLMILANFPDLFAPEGIAIHRLISDLRG